MWEHIKRYRTVAFHALYGVPCALVALMDGLRGVDFSPFFSQHTAAMIASGVAIGAVVLHFFADTHFGSIRDDGTAGQNLGTLPPAPVDAQAIGAQDVGVHMGDHNA